MKQVVIENPIINSPFVELQRNYYFVKNGITSEIVNSCRVISYFVLVPKPKKRGAQPTLFETEWTEERIKNNQLINDVRIKVALWRIVGYYGDSFIVRHAYFTGADKPYEKLKKSLRAEINEEILETLYSTKSYPFDISQTGKIALKVINHFGDEKLLEFDIKE